MLKFTEACPTAGLALSWRDLLVLPFFTKAQNTLERKLAHFLGIEDAQVECSGTATFSCGARGA
jgi:hypothetical protein